MPYPPTQTNPLGQSAANQRITNDLQREDLEMLEKKLSGEKMEIDIVTPLSFWLAILTIGIILQIVVIPVFGPNLGTYPNLLPSVAKWILYLPGSVVLPLLVSLWIGERVGASGNKPRNAMVIGGINGFYADLVYAIAMFVIYLLLAYITPQFFSSVSATPLTTYSFLESVLVVPIVIVGALVPIVSGISAARRGL